MEWWETYMDTAISFAKDKVIDDDMVIPFNHIVDEYCGIVMFNDGTGISCKSWVEEPKWFIYS